MLIVRVVLVGGVGVDGHVPLQVVFAKGAHYALEDLAETE